MAQILNVPDKNTISNHRLNEMLKEFVVATKSYLPGWRFICLLMISVFICPAKTMCLEGNYWWNNQFNNRAIHEFSSVVADMLRDRAAIIECIGRSKDCLVGERKLMENFLELAQDKKFSHEKINLVNLFINGFNYIPETSINKNVWLMPRVFIMRGGGDCEDFALAKYQFLRLLGFNESKMMIMLLRHRKTNEGHAVLGVWADSDSKLLILDNNSNILRSLEDFLEWEFLLSFNDVGWNLSISNDILMTDRIIIK